MKHRSRLTTILATLLLSWAAAAQSDTLYISTDFTTHVIFPTDLTYADLSISRIVVAKIIEQNKNMLALKARCEFEESTSISALESNGRMHTFIVKYMQHPETLIIDTRVPEKDTETVQPVQENGSVSRNRKTDAPLLSEVIGSRQELFHIGAEGYGIRVLCENILSYSDITYVVLSLKQKSTNVPAGKTADPVLLMPTFASTTLLTKAVLSGKLRKAHWASGRVWSDTVSHTLPLA